MLVLTRRKNESIIINDNIRIVVIGVYGDRVRLGIEAPPEIPVHRKEVFDLIKRKLAENTGKPEEPARSSQPPAEPGPGESPRPSDLSQEGGGKISTEHRRPASSEANQCEGVAVAG